MGILVMKELKQVSLVQALVNAVEPRSSLSLIVFGLGVKVEKVFGSKWLLTELKRLGLFVSPDEATQCKQSVVCNESMLEFLKTNPNGSSSQWSAGNVNLNVCTIDGKSPFHSMEIVISTTPGRHAQGLTPIPRQKRRAVKEFVKGE